MNKKSIGTERVFEELVKKQQRQEPCALVLLIEAKGSAPAKAGAKMVVFANGDIAGTVGGGTMEKEAVDAALLAMEKGEATLHHVDLSAAPTYVCGGRATLYIEPVLPASRLIIAGAGHVGQALCKAAAAVGFSVIVADDRPEFADPKLLPDAARVITSDFETMFEQLRVGPSASIVCATRGHAHDYTVIRKALATSASYVGLVGSRRKRTSFLKRLQQEAGVGEEDLVRLYTPVGLDIGACSPAEIAVSITAQLIQKRNSHGLQDGIHSARGRGFTSHGADKAAAAAAE
jgi:xanthine dehydrogenase accessory factor